MADELGKLDRLRQSGALSEAEFAAAKRALLQPAVAPVRDDSIGRAANRYVSFQMVAGVVGLVLFLVFLFAVIVPAMDSVNNPVVPQFPGFEQGPVPLR
ncbi:SHOCT domain-containing protein [Umezawaea tangerina]|uniref:Putative oligomerization/nucleic acid binding protein n=1 Tax=Umezawaea tangerina TaxID=84725 RepID=A0A2T0STN9_9PSEU|nr:SHOCT domain-containing protein [Umezawaea tangerina]PRY36787.1 putative oligomerization/nucleic acid binding protein [Umezawaea tangerina]